MVLAAEKVYCGPLGEVVGDLADKLVPSTSCSFEGAHEVYAHELKRRINGIGFDVPGVSQLVCFPHHIYVTVRHVTVKFDGMAVLPVHEIKDALDEVNQPPVPHLSFAHCMYRQLLFCIAVRADV